MSLGVNVPSPVKPQDLSRAAKTVAKDEFTYHVDAAPAVPNTNSAIWPAVRLFATFMTLGVSESVNKGIKKILVIGLSKALTTTYSTREKRQEWLNEFKKDPHYKDATRLSVKIGENTQLDGVLIKPNLGGESEQYVIWLNPLTASFEGKLRLTADYADTIDANILIFNYRGTGESTSNWPVKPEDLVTDTKAMIAYLTEVKGIKPENIVIHGHSLGGGVGAHAATGTPGVREINDRSFSAFSKAAKEMISASLQDKVGKTIAKSLGSLTATLIRGYDLDLNPSKVYEAADSEILFLHHLKDEMINKSSVKKSLENHEVTSKNPKNHKFVDLSDSKHKYSSAHNDYFLNFDNTAGHVYQFIHGKALVFGVVKPDGI